jgi:hypothetical protein
VNRPPIRPPIRGAATLEGREQTAEERHSVEHGRHLGVLVIGVGAAAGDPEPVEGRHAERAAEVAVAAAADGEADRGRQPDGGRHPGRQFEQLGGGGVLQRRPVHPAAHVQAGGRVPRHQGRHRRLDPIALGQVGHPQVDADAGLGRHDVVGRPRRRHGRCHRRAELGASQLGDGEHLMGRLHQCVHALLGFQSGVGRPPVNDDLEAAGALAGHLERPAGAGRLQHQHRSTRARPLLDQRPGRARADLLVGGEQQLDPRGVGQGGDGVDGHHDPALHVEHAGAGDPSALDRERAGGEGAAREHGVVVAHDDDARLAATRPVHVGAGRAGDQLGARAQTSLDDAGESVRRRRQCAQVERRRLHLHQRPQVGQHGGEVGGRHRLTVQV